MRLLDALSTLQRLDEPILETADAAACLGMSRAHASKIMARLAESGQLLALRQGLWGFHGRVEALLLPERLTAPQPAYVSLQSALYHHGMISQMPAVVYAVSLARTRRYATPVGAVSVHHVSPAFFFGYDTTGNRGIRIAVPEKALLDVFYLAPARTGLFHSLPEVERIKGFNMKEARRMIARIPSSRRRAMVESRFDQWVRTT